MSYEVLNMFLNVNKMKYIFSHSIYFNYLKKMSRRIHFANFFRLTNCSVLKVGMFNTFHFIFKLLLLWYENFNHFQMFYYSL